MAHHAHNALYDVVDVGEVTLAVAVIEDLNILVAHQFVGEAEVCHVGTAGRTVDGIADWCLLRDVPGGLLHQCAFHAGHCLVRGACGG